jgi:hypothetical protein
MKMRSRKDWRKYCNTPDHALPAGVPIHPDGIYKKWGWEGWRNWLGTEKKNLEDPQNE